MKVRHPCVRRLQEGAKRYRRGRWHARDRGECRHPGVGAGLGRRRDDVAGAAPGLCQALPSGNVADLLRGQGARRSCQDGGDGQRDMASRLSGDAAQIHGHLEIRSFQMSLAGVTIRHPLISINAPVRQGTPFTGSRMPSRRHLQAYLTRHAHCSSDIVSAVSRPDGATRSRLPATQ